ncbi:MAG: AI-2E family transporter [Halieaceae bacterium]|jgi:predicted PurR-regulated permease PerM|nr:AI-2E family transporter [Halieaceae bacterium]
MSETKADIAQQTTDTRRAMEVTVRIGLVLGLLIWCFEIVRPFISTLIWALIIASALLPLYTSLRSRLGISQGLAATLFTLVLLAAIITPSLMLSGTMVSTAREFASELKDGSLQVPAAPQRVQEIPIVGEQLFQIWQQANQNLQSVLQQFEKQIRTAARWLVNTAAGAGLGILQFAVAVAVSGIFLAFNEEGSEFARRLGGRLAGKDGETFAALASNTVRSVAQGVLGVAVIQAILAGVGLLVAGVPGAGLWTLLVLILATVQLPTIVVLLPVVAWYASVSDGLATILFGIYMLGVALSDNILKPILLGRGSSQPMAVIFLGAIGGFLLQGIVGLFTGAVVLALGYEVFMLWLNQDLHPGNAEASDND